MAEKTHEEKLIDLLLAIPVYKWSNKNDVHFEAELNGIPVFLLPSNNDNHFTIGNVSVMPDQKIIKAYVDEINDYNARQKYQSYQRKCAEIYKLLTDKKE